MVLAGFLDFDLYTALRGLGFYDVKFYKDHKHNKIALSCKVVVFDLLKDNADFLQNLYDWHGLNKTQVLQLLSDFGVYNFDSVNGAYFDTLKSIDDTCKLVKIDDNKYYTVDNYTVNYIDDVLQSFIDILNVFKERTEVYR